MKDSKREAMNDVEEKLEQHIDEFVSNDADADEWGENARRLVMGAVRAELERAAQIAEQLDHKGCVMLSDCHSEIAAAIRRQAE